MWVSRMMQRIDAVYALYKASTRTQKKSIDRACVLVSRNP